MFLPKEYVTSLLSKFLSESAGEQLSEQEEFIRGTIFEEAPHIDSSHEGRLHKALGVPYGHKIPASALRRAKHSKNPHMRQMANFAANAKHWDHDRVDEAVSFNKGDRVVPNIGPHAGHEHEIIHKHTDGTFNIKPTSIPPHKIAYRLGAARCHAGQIEHIDEADPVEAHHRAILNLRSYLPNSKPTIERHALAMNAHEAGSPEAGKMSDIAWKLHHSFMKDNGLNESAPPGMEDDALEMKPKFIERYGKKKGLEILYSTLWKKHNKLNESADGDMTHPEVKKFADYAARQGYTHSGSSQTPLVHTHAFTKGTHEFHVVHGAPQFGEHKTKFDYSHVGKGYQTGSGLLTFGGLHQAFHNQD
jgi:hypothetical protein